MTRPSPERLDDLAVLVDYPERDVRPVLERCVAELSAVSPEAAADLEAFGEAMAVLSLEAQQESYIEAFDLSPACALDLGWHLFGDAHERGAFMAALRDDLARLGIPETSDLPDHLTHVLALAGREAPGRAALLVDLVSPAVGAVARALEQRGSPYRRLLAAVTRVLALIEPETLPARGAS